ncbi:MAG: radical SAM protein [Candidatus Omnitrophica bacterium]|nr:radical SAM protein [Candidatus Omnitrophota bacterium]
MNEDGRNIFPSYCCVALLESCFMRCKMCFKWKDDINYRSPEEPSFDQWKAFLRGLAELCERKFSVNFAGGEPLARTETLPLIRFARELGFETLLATNAYLIDEPKAREIAGAGVSDVVISLDGSNSATHDFLRGKTGSFRNVIAAIDYLDKYARPIKISLCTVISAVNLSEVVKLVRWAEADGRFYGICFQAITQPFSTAEDPLWYKKDEFSFLWPTDMGLVDTVTAELVGLKNSGALRNGFMIHNPAHQFDVFRNYFRDPKKFIKTDKCHLDYRAINVTPLGDVHICFNKPAIGNIKSADIRTLWFSDKAQRVRREIQACRRNCQALVNCNYDEKADYVA